MRLRNVLAAVLLLAATAACDRLQSADGSQRQGESTRALALRVKLELLQKLGTDALRVEVDSQGDKVRLSGEVKKRATAELAEDVARKVEGVRSVENDLRVAGEHMAKHCKNAINKIPPKPKKSFPVL